MFRVIEKTQKLVEKDVYHRKHLFVSIIFFSYRVKRLFSYLKCLFLSQ